MHEKANQGKGWWMESNHPFLVSSSSVIALLLEHQLLLETTSFFLNKETNVVYSIILNYSAE